MRNLKLFTITDAVVEVGGNWAEELGEFFGIYDDINLPSKQATFLCFFMLKKGEKKKIEKVLLPLSLARLLLLLSE